MSNRPELQQVFLSLEKRLQVYFYTSNIPKFLQARVVFDKVGLNLRHFRGKSDPYEEDYSQGKAQLLVKALEEVGKSVSTNYLVFIEDTSLRIEALSDEIDYPGLSVKEWFLTTTFAQLDYEIKKNGNNRKAIIKSDIALHVPWLKRPLFFYGESVGQVANSPPDFTESTAYPWLTPNSFNGWFIPEGSNKRLGEMSFEESWKYDFRVKSLLGLTNRLEEYAAILNLPTQSYVRKVQIQTQNQLQLLPKEANTYIVIGKTCAGKTTFGEYALRKPDFRFIEASSIIRIFKDQYPNDTDPFILAKHFLETEGPDIVAKKILELYSSDLANGAIITGFRTIEELEAITQALPQAKVILVEASEKTRFERYLQRSRDASLTTIDAFRSLDKRQWSFGLLRVAEDFADIKITNEGKIEEYFRQIDRVITGQKIRDVLGISSELRPRHEAEHDQLYKSLIALRQSEKPLDCGEIENATIRAGAPVRHNNANKVLKKVPELVARIETHGKRIRYEITNTGLAYLRFIELKSGKKLEE